MQYSPDAVNKETIFPGVLGFNVIMMDQNTNRSYSVHLPGSEIRSYTFDQTEAAGPLSDSGVVMVQVETQIGTFSSNLNTFSGLFELHNCVQIHVCLYMHIKFSFETIYSCHNTMLLYSKPMPEVVFHTQTLPVYYIYCECLCAWVLLHVSAVHNEAGGEAQLFLNQLLRPLFA